MKKCSKCKMEKPIEEFNFKIKKIGFRNYQCKTCSRLSIKNHYINNKAYYLVKAKKRNLEVKRKTINFLLGYLLKNPCIDCGESDPTVLEFDHRDGVNKIKEVSRLLRDQASLGVIQEEISKCEVRCANCHRRRTAKKFKWLKSMPL